jgi:hypothetical protein
MTRLRLVRLVSVLLLASLILAPVVLAQSNGVYFPQTGHTVKEPFLSFFDDNGGVKRFGYPMTSAFTENGMYMQYFQKARFEWHPENPDRYKVQLGLLGEELGKREPPIPVSRIPSPSDPGCYYFEATGQMMCHKFLDYWRDNGGLDVFGYPIGGYTIENNRIVQYFQRARFEWHPEKPDGQRVQTALIGEMYFTYAGLNREWLRPEQPSAISGEMPMVTSLRARGSVADAVVARGALQTAHVSVADQLGRPMAGAEVTMIVHFPNGDQYFPLLPTDDKGTSSFSFNAGKYTPGTVISLEFSVTYGAVNTTTRTSYLMWFY